MSNRSTSLNGDNVASDLLNVTSITLAAWYMKMPITPIVLDVLLKKVKQPMLAYVNTFIGQCCRSVPKISYAAVARGCAWLSDSIA